MGKTLALFVIQFKVNDAVSHPSPHPLPPPPPPAHTKLKFFTIYTFPLYNEDIRGLDKEMRAWDAFTGLDSLVKNMVTSLRAVGELQNSAIRDRHWEQLMQATQVTIVFD